MFLLKIWNELGKNFRRVYIPQHILFIFGIISIITGNTSAWWLLLIYPSWFLFAHIGFGIFIHKHLCHRSFETNIWYSRFGTYLGMLSGTGSPILTKSQHIGQHHLHCDTENDVHSPSKGKWWSYVGWANHKWDFRNIKIVRDLIKDPYMKFYHKHYYFIYWGSWILLAMIDWRLAIFSISAASVLKFHQDGIVNTWGHLPHKWSYQNYKSDDGMGMSQNIPWLNWITFGLGLHNNHHAKPWEYDYAHFPGEFDFAKWFVPLIKIKRGLNNESK
jgi:fatty-acid desaturase